MSPSFHLATTGILAGVSLLDLAGERIENRAEAKDDHRGNAEGNHEERGVAAEPAEWGSHIGKPEPKKRMSVGLMGRREDHPCGLDVQAY